MEIQIFSLETSQLQGYRYCLAIGESLELISNLVFESWLDALREAIKEYREDWQPYLEEV